MTEYPSTWIMTGDRIGNRTVVARTLESPKQGDRAGFVVFTYDDGTTERVSTLDRVRIGGTVHVPARRTTVASDAPSDAPSSGDTEWSGESWESKQEAMRDFARELADAVEDRRQS